jgi:hypothetical protein
VGTLTFLCSLLITKLFKLKNIILNVGLNLVLYLLATFLIVPNIAPLFGRVAITQNEHLKPANYWISVGLNRNYVVPELDNLLTSMSGQMAEANPDVVIYFLDANFPFINNYSLAPHLSHNDGRKVDLAYMYTDAKGELIVGTPSRSGYGYFEGPEEGERNTTQRCKAEGFSRYDYPKYLTLGVKQGEYRYSNKWNAAFMKVLLSHEVVAKVFVEPHLVDRLNLQDSRIRFHGCTSVRHDDHIHVQI